MTPSPSPHGIAMDLGDLIEIDAILPSMKAVTKKQVLQELCERAAERTGLAAKDILDTVTQRERLGSTGVGNGIAIPHGKLPDLTRLVGVFGRLNRPVDFDSLDDQPVDLVFLLLAPGGSGAEHLKALSKIARLLRNAGTVAQLRESRDAEAIYALMTESVPPPAPTQAA